MQSQAILHIRYKVLLIFALTHLSRSHSALEVFLHCFATYSSQSPPFVVCRACQTYVSHSMSKQRRNSDAQTSCPSIEDAMQREMLPMDFQVYLYDSTLKPYSETFEYSGKVST